METAVKEIKNSSGKVIVRIHGDINIDVMARSIYGLKQVTEKKASCK